MPRDLPRRPLEGGRVAAAGDPIRRTHRAGKAFCRRALGRWALAACTAVACEPRWALAEPPVVVFESQRDGNWEIYARRHGVEQRLTDDPAQDRQPALSGGGALVAFTSDRSGGQDIYLVSAGGGRAVRLTDSVGDDFSPAWCEGDSQIVFVSCRGGLPDLYIMRADGAQQHVLGRREGVAYEPAWSPEVPTANQPPTAWMAAGLLSPGVVRFSLAGTWDREQGRRLRGTLSFGDGADTSFAVLPDRVEHRYAGEGVYNATLRVEDRGQQAALALLELGLRSDLRVRLHDLHYERAYTPRPLDR